MILTPDFWLLTPLPMLDRSRWSRLRYLRFLLNEARLFVLITRTKAGCTIFKRGRSRCTFLTRNGLGLCLPVMGFRLLEIYPHSRSQLSY